VSRDLLRVAYRRAEAAAAQAHAQAATGRVRFRPRLGGDLIFMARRERHDDQENELRELSRTPLVRAEGGLGPPGRPVTAVFLHGEHDFGCRALLADVLEPLYTDLIVDLSWCTFADSAIIALIIGKHAALEREGHHLEVIVPPTHRQLARTLDRLGARSLLRVRDAPPPADRCGRGGP
jgi:anti-anti-sigma regulatory factor